MTLVELSAAKDLFVAEAGVEEFLRFAQDDGVDDPLCRAVTRRPRGLWSAGVLARWSESVSLSAAARRRRASGRDGRAPKKRPAEDGV